MTTPPLVKLSHVYWQQEGMDILSDISLEIHACEIVTLIGPNGAGKTSLVNLITGLSSPTKGHIIRLPQLKIGYVPQRLKLDKSLPMRVKKLLKLANRDEQALYEYSELLGIDHLLNAQLHTLSGGEMQRVLLTRAALLKPQLLVLDEPTQGVDALGQVELYQQISLLRQKLQCGILMVSHDLHLVMAQTDRVICLNHHVCCHGEPESVTTHPEYLELFGPTVKDNIAVYTHHHDHQHNLQGEVIHTHGEKDA